MEYKNIVQGKFIARPNRFIAHVEIDGAVEICHVKNTGRCRELLIPGTTVFVQDCQSPTRKTRYDLIFVYKGDRLINMDSQIPNKVFAEWVRKGNLFSGGAIIKPETGYGNSRFDFYIEEGTRKAFVEVKGVTLEENGVALFPDAPTLRGVKHLDELCRCVEAGYDAYAVFIIQMDRIRHFTPNMKMHPEFGHALHAAKKAGVKILALDCEVTKDSITAKDFVEIKLPG